jgi:hypothetical protein
MGIRTQVSSGRIAAIAAGAILVAAAAAGGSSPAGASLAAPPHWHITKLITVANTVLNDVAALPGGTAWAGGQTPSHRESVYNLTGGQWHPVALAGPPGSFVADVSATSAANVWFSNNEDQVGHRSGNGWTIKSFGPNIQLRGVLTLGPHDTWAFAHKQATGQSFAHHYDGTSWKTTTLPADPAGITLTGAYSASSGSNIWTWAWTAASFLTMHYNGHKWQTVSLPAGFIAAIPNVGPERMLAESPSNVWASADASSLQGNNLVPGPIVLLHWNGHSWTKITGQLPAGALTGPMASDGHGGLWLSAVTPDDQPFLAHYRASGAWTSYPMPVETVGVMRVTSLKLIPGTRLVLGVSDLGYSFGATNGAAFLRVGP